jgi:putative SOS response-associated peptidase YedK
MCGRYPQSKRARDSVHAFGVPAGLAPRPETWNLAPSTASLVVRRRDNDLTADWLTWGLAVPVHGMKPINARVETALSKSLFRESWRSRRCVVPADGWFEWKAEKGRKQPYFFFQRGGEPIFFAGIGLDESFALLTTSATGAHGEIHHRRPLALRAEDGKTWIDKGAESASELILGLIPAADILFHAVSARVNSTREDGPSLLKPWAGEIQEPLGDLFGRKQQ